MDNMVVACKQPQQTFLQKHKKKINYILAFSGGLLAGILACKNKNLISWIEQLFEHQITESTSTPVVITQLDSMKSKRIQHIDVPMYVRKLPFGYTISSEKLKIATELGYEIGENQTWVTPYDYDKKIKTGG